MAEAETSGRILARAVELARDNALPAVLAIIGLAALDTILEVGSRGTFAVSGVTSLITQYVLSVIAMRRLGLVGDDERGQKILPMVGLLILTGAATLLGLLLLIVPGVILAVRWWIVVPILLAEDVTVGAAMRQSWERTADRFWPIFGVIAINIAAIFAASAAAALAVEGNRVGTFAMNLIIDAAVVSLWYAAVGTYEHSRPATNELEEVFA
jgi:hypothetical protein